MEGYSLYLCDAWSIRHPIARCTNGRALAPDGARNGRPLGRAALRFAVSAQWARRRRPAFTTHVNPLAKGVLQTVGPRWCELDPGVHNYHGSNLSYHRCSADG